MSKKFQRSYRIVIDFKDGSDPIIIKPPLTCQFWVKRNTMASANYCSIDIYNLGKNLRDRIFQDRFVVRDTVVTFEAGYDTLSLMFKGELFHAFSSRDGTNIITRMELKSGNYDMTTTKTFQTISGGQGLKEVLGYLAGQFPNLERGVIGSFPEVFKRPVTLNGNTYDLMRKYSNNKVHVDNNKIYVLKDNEAIEGDVPAINIDSGLIDVRRDAGFLNVTTLLEPRITIDQVVDLKSPINPIYNGQYKCLGILHQGIISEAVGGACRSVFDLLTGNTIFEVKQPNE